MAAVGRRPLSHEQRPEVFLGFMRVVGSAPELKIRSRRGSAVRKRDDVVELEETALGAPSGVPFESAPATVPIPHLTPG